MAQSKTFSIGELFTLRSEITVIITEKLKMVFKLELTELFEAVNKVLAPVEKLRQELIDKYLKEEMATEGKKAEDCSQFAQFEIELKELLEQERELTYTPSKKAYWDFESNQYYPNLMKLVEGNEKTV